MAAIVTLTVSSLDKTLHARSDFHCGQPALDDFLKTQAAKHQTQRLSRTFVLADSAALHHILGFYSLSNCQIARADLPESEARSLPRHPVPAVLLARLAVDVRHQGKRYGHWLLMDALKRCALIGRESGVYALVVDAKDEAAATFHRRFGFASFTGNGLSLYLPLATALRALS